MTTRMSVADLRRRLATTVVRTKKSLAGVRAGQFRTLQRGSGSDFDQLRDYMPGDDVRFIDWKSSARADRLVLRQYRDERSRVMMVVLDTSASMNYGTGALSALEAAFHVATILAVIAEIRGDALGLYLLADGPVCALPPISGPRQTEALVDCCTALSAGHGTGFCPQSLSLLGQGLRQKSLLFLLSDFAQTADFAAALEPLSVRHACYALRMRDGDEQLLLDNTRFMGLGLPLDKERKLLPLETAANRARAERALALFFSEQEQAFKRARVPFFDCFFAREEYLLSVVLRGLQKIVR